MPRFHVRRRKSVRPFRAMRKARMYRSMGLARFGNTVGRYVARKASSVIHWFRKEIPFTNYNEGGVNLNGVYYFQGYQVPDWSDLADNYDQFLVKKIIVTFEPCYSGSNTNAVAPLQKWMRVVHDYNDANPLSNESEYLDYSNCKSYLITRPKPIRVTLYPKVNVGVQANSGGASFTKIQKPGWLSTNTEASQVPMYGIKFMIPTLGLTSGQTIARMRVTAVLGFKNIR